MDHPNTALPDWATTLADGDPVGTAMLGWWRTLTTVEQLVADSRLLFEACALTERAFAGAEALVEAGVELEDELTFIFTHIGLPHPERLTAWVL